MRVRLLGSVSSLSPFYTGLASEEKPVGHPVLLLVTCLDFEFLKFGRGYLLVDNLPFAIFQHITGNAKLPSYRDSTFFNANVGVDQRDRTTGEIQQNGLSDVLHGGGSKISPHGNPQPCPKIRSRRDTRYYCAKGPYIFSQKSECVMDDETYKYGNIEQLFPRNVVTKYETTAKHLGDRTIFT